MVSTTTPSAASPLAVSVSCRLVGRASACTGPAEPYEAPGRVAWCDPTTQLAFQAIGSPGFVYRLTDQLDPRTAQYPESMIDPNWVTTDEKQPWQSRHGPGTWIVGYSYPFGFDHARLADSEAQALRSDLERRWKRLDRDHRELTREHQLEAALTALTGPPLPRLQHVWDGRTLRLSSTRLHDAELVLDFAELAASAPGPTAAALMGLQLHAVISHYYTPKPTASACLTTANPPSGCTTCVPALTPRQLTPTVTVPGSARNHSAPCPGPHHPLSGTGSGQHWQCARW
jgi:hypothetical protein